MPERAPRSPLTLRNFAEISTFSDFGGVIKVDRKCSTGSVISSWQRSGIRLQSKNISYIIM